MLTQPKHFTENKINPALYLQGVLDSSQHGIMAFDAVRDEDKVIVDFRWTMVNKAAETMTGRNYDDLAGKYLLQEMPGNREDGLFDKYVYVVENDEPLNVEHYYEHEGMKTWFHITAHKLMDGFVVTFDNITERKNLQAEVEQQFEELSRFFEVSPDLLSIASMDGNFLKVNGAWEATLGYTKEELEGTPFLSFVHPDDLEETISVIEQLTTGEPVISFQNRYRHADGSYRILEWRTSPDIDRGVGYSAARDVTAQQAILTMLEESEKRFALAFHSSSVPLVMSQRVDEGSLFVDANQAYLDLIGYEWAELKGRTLQSLNLAVSSINGTSSIERLRTLDEQGEYSLLEATLRNRSGEIRHVMGSGQRCKMHDMILDIDILLDITDRKRAEQQAIALEMERTRAGMLTDFIQGSSHEFRTPLAIIQSSAYLLSMTDDDDKKTQKLDVIGKQINRLTDIVETLKKSAVLGAHSRDEWQPVAIASLVSSLVDNKRYEHPNADITLEIADTSQLQVFGYVDALREVFSQILDNALQHSGVDSVIMVTVSTEDEMMVTRIQDTGVGIPEADLPHIFEHFYRVDKAHSTPGLGLGLALSKTITENHGGTIHAESTLGEGSCFVIHLPHYRDGFR